MAFTRAASVARPPLIANASAASEVKLHPCRYCAGFLCLGNMLISIAFKSALQKAPGAYTLSVFGFPDSFSNSKEQCQQSRLLIPQPSNLNPWLYESASATRN